MRNYKKTVRACLMYVFVVIAAAGYPLSAFAEVAPDSSTTTQVVTEPPKETYTFNPDTNHWDTSKWQFDPVSGQYQPKSPVAPVAPEPAAPVAPVAPMTPGLTSASSSPSTTGSGEQTPPAASSDTTVSTATNVGNNLTSQAQTGNAGVRSNTAAGNATSGDAAATTTVVNAVHSTVQGGTEGVAHFSADIYGNVIGDITLAPALEDALSKSSSHPASDTTIQSSNDTSLTNNLTLGATSGDASVTDNTKAGNATTGTANTVANVINLINSIIAANQSFVGTINIYGNLNGDILISPTFIPQLLASNASNGDGSTTSTVLGTEDTQSIINNVSLNAASGTANVADNTKAGNATTGTAATNLTILNYTGHEIVASNSLLVFVNVLGKWVGIIVDAPVGATAAALGNGVTSNVGSGANQTIDASNKSTITNNIDLTSLSGDANVTGNTSAGNATSGNATASANIANISTSSFSISDWFGILFINVYGTWLGSFGVDTENGTVTPITASPVTPLKEAPATVVKAPQFGFRPHTRDSRTGTITPVIDPPVQAEVASVLISQPEATVASDNIPVVISETPQTNPYSFVMIMASLIGAAVAAAIGLYRRQDSFPV